jgi:hypothetical protein
MDKPYTPGSESERRHASSDDMTKVNRYMKRIKFKMEGVSTLTNLINKNDYAISFDLKTHTTTSLFIQVCVPF